MESMVLVGSDDVGRAGRQIQAAAQQMADVAARIEYAFEQRRRWEEEYLARIEAIVREELDFYAPKPAEPVQVCACGHTRGQHAPESGERAVCFGEFCQCKGFALYAPQPEKE